jgi:parvulin-like peptidyl-prolyl isomerase
LAKKQKKIEHKHLTRRQITRHERERKTQHIILIAAAVVLILVLAFSGYGYYDSQYKPFHQVVLKVNNAQVDMDYFITMFKLYMENQDINVASLYAPSILTIIENNLLIIQAAPELGYDIDPQDVQQALADNKVPNKAVYRDLYKTSLYQNLLKQEYFGQDIPASAEQVKVQALVFETEKAANEGIAASNNGTDFLTLAQTYGVEQITKEKGGDLGWLPKGLTARVLGLQDASVLEKVAFSTENGTISKPVYDPNIVKGTGYWLVKLEEKDAEKSLHARIILLGSEADAIQAKKRLDNGEDFATLAKEISMDDATKADGGDIGWVQAGYGDAVIMQVGFKLEPGKISDPVRDIAIETKGGYWVVKVIGKEENRVIDQTLKDNLMQIEYQNWLTQRREASTIEELLSEAQKQWATNIVVKALSVTK